MIKEANVSFEVAKLLKEKGFEEPTRMVWYEHLPKENACHPTEIYKPKLDLYYPDAQTEREIKFSNSMPVDEYIYGDVFAAPTHQMACAWLREVYGIHVSAIPCAKRHTIVWQQNIINLKPIKEGGMFLQLEPNRKDYNSYEEAVEAACLYVLNNLI